jgi:hypothetical protein
MAKNQVAVKEEFQLMSDTLPDYMKQGNRGAENVGTEDMIVPRIELIQALSPVRKKSDPAYIEGAEEGMLYNNVTRALYGTEVTVIPVYYTKQFLVWKDRKLGGGGSNGFRGAFATEAAARDAIAQLAEDGLEVADTAQHFVLVRNGDDWQEAVVSMSKSKIKVSKRWNSLMRLTNTDSFSRAYKLSATVETNARNESYFNFNITALGFVTKDIYERAEKLYETVRTGGVKVSNDYEGEVHDAAPTEY